MPVPLSWCSECPLGMIWKVSPLTRHPHKCPHPDAPSAPLHPHQHAPPRESCRWRCCRTSGQERQLSQSQVTCTFVSSIPWQPPLTLETHGALTICRGWALERSLVYLVTLNTTLVAGQERVCSSEWSLRDSHHCLPCSPPLSPLHQLGHSRLRRGRVFFL